MTDALVVFSNPGDSDRLRLDKEHKAISAAVQKSNASEEKVLRFHATSFRDLVRLLSRRKYSLVQFSGHGTGQGILLEADVADGHQEVTAERLNDLLHETNPGLETLILMCCYSSKTRPVLAQAAKNLITVSGAADDESCVKFVEFFFELYLQGHEPEFAARMARHLVAEDLDIVFSRRVEVSARIVDAFKVQDEHGRGLYCDLTEAEDDIIRLGVDRDAFLSLLGRKLRLHRTLFQSDRERAVIPIGKYLGVFTWSGPDDLMTCHAIRVWRDGLTAEEIQSFAGFIVDYNDSTVSPYRRDPSPHSPGIDDKISTGIHDMRGFFFYIRPGGKCEPLRRFDPDAFSVANGIISAATDRAEAMLAKQRYPEAISQLEMALSSAHDLIDSLLEKLTQRPNNPMHPSGEVGRIEVDNLSSPPGDR